MSQNNLIAKNRFINLMNLVNSDFNGKIRDLCVAIEIEHLANYLSHTTSPKKKIGNALARTVESKLSLRTGFLDQPAILMTPSSSNTFSEDEQIRSSNVLMLVDILGCGNVRRASEVLETNLVNHTYRGRSCRPVSNKLARYIESKLNLEEFSFDSPLNKALLIRALPKDIRKDYLIHVHSVLNEAVVDIKSIKECQEEIADNLLKSIVDFIEATTSYQYLSSSDPQRVLIPINDASKKLPVFVKEGGDSQIFYLIGFKGFTPSLNKYGEAIDHISSNFASYTLSDSRQLHTTVLNMRTLKHKNFPKGGRRLELEVKRASNEYQNLLDAYLTAKSNVKRLYNDLIDILLTEIGNVKHHDRLDLDSVMDNVALHKGFKIPLVKVRNTETSYLSTYITSVLHDDLRIEEIYEFISMERGNGINHILPTIVTQNGNLICDQVSTSKSWLASR